MSADTRPETTLAQPLRTRRVCVPKVWGGRALETRPGLVLDVEGPIGETWEVFDHDEGSSPLGEGRYAGSTLRGLMLSERDALLGSARPAPRERFPVIVKFLSAMQPLSIQVHPDASAAPRLGAGEQGKHESWYIVDAEPGALVYLGLREGVDAAELTAHGDSPAVVDLLEAWPVKAGQFLDVPGGTLHAIGEGVSLLEIQNNADVTYRLFDWGRVGLDGKPRRTHVAEALLATRFDLTQEGPREPEFSRREGTNRGALLVDTEHYSMELLDVVGSLHADTGGRAVIYVPLEGGGELCAEADGETAPTALSPGDTCIVPAATGTHVLSASGAGLRVMRVETRP